MKIIKTVYHPNLLPAFSYTVQCGKYKKEFLYKDKANIGKYVMDIWKNQPDDMFPVYDAALIFANITWDYDNILYCKYEYVSE